MTATHLTISGDRYVGFKMPDGSVRLFDKMNGRIALVFNEIKNGIPYNCIKNRPNLMFCGRTIDRVKQIAKSMFPEQNVVEFTERDFA